jgi:hypothetical protein
VPRGETMKVIIMSCSDRSFWYKDKIGKTFNVVKSDSKRYYTKTRDGKTVVPLLKTDCEVI